MDSEYIKSIRLKVWMYKILQKFKYRADDWNRLMTFFLIEMEYLPVYKKDILASLYYSLSLSFYTPIDTIKTVFESTNVSVQLTEIPYMEVEDDPRGNVITVRIDNISRRIERSRYEKININSNLLRSCVIRYSPLSFRDSFVYLSFPSIVYETISNNSPYPSVECFTTPFSFNLNSFCSIFDSDKDTVKEEIIPSTHSRDYNQGYLERENRAKVSMRYSPGITCHGQFFPYVNDLDESRTLISFPFDSDRLINRTLETLMAYKRRVPKSCVVVFIHPNDNLEMIEQFKQEVGVITTEIDAESYKLVDNVTEQKIPQNKPLLIMVNLDNDTILSQRVMWQITNSLK